MSKFSQTCRRQTAAVLAAGLALAAPAAWAAGTASGTDISNNANVSFSVSGVTQTAVSNSVTFKVDNVVRLEVIEGNTTATLVAPGSTAQVTTFRVTNQGNTTQDYALTAANLANGTTLSLGATTYTDAFDGNACVVRVESGTTADYQAGEDTATSIVNLPADQSRTVYVICNIPSTVTNGQDAIVSLTATTSNAGSCSTTCATTQQTATADNPAAVDVVFGDLAGTDDVARDGKGSARDAYRVNSASLSISKTVTPVCDPFNNNANPKSIPGAYVRYEITVSNAAGSGASATLTTITDALPAAIAFDADQRTGSPTACATSAPASGVGLGFRLSCTGGTRACVGTPVFFTGAGDTDAVTVTGQNVTVTAGNGPGGTKALPSETGYAAGELKPGESMTIRFNAIIQ